MTTIRVLLLAILVQLSSLTWAQTQPKQDVIIKRNGDKIACHVTQISDKEVFYGEENMPANVFRTVPLPDVAAILYGNGLVQNFPAPPPPPAPTQAPAGTPGQVETYPSPAQGQVQQPVFQAAPVAPTYSQQELFAKGIVDGGVFYSRYGGASSGTFVTTFFLGGIVGLIPAIACSSTPPKIHNLGIPPSEYATNPTYIAGYTQSARKKKNKKVWSNYGIAVGVNIALFLILSAK